MASRKKILAEMDIIINELVWHLRLMSHSAFVAEYKRKDIAAMTTTGPDIKRIDFNVRDFSPKYIQHELAHAYWETMPVESTKNITVDDLEEILASFISSYNTPIYEKTFLIYETLRKGIL